MQNINIELLKSYGLKATPQRIDILNTIEKLGHANIDEIYEIVKKSNPTISLATVYKNITALVEKALLKEVALNNFKSKYEIIKDRHSHLICKVCGKVTDVELNNEILLLSEQLSNNNNFNYKDIELNIYGICSSCA
jgi:Fe2+ or Zn2+ uptake regulation protein